MGKIEDIASIYSNNEEKEVKTPVLTENNDNTVDSTAENKADTNDIPTENNDNTVDSTAENKADTNDIPLEEIEGVEVVEKDELIKPKEPKAIEPEPKKEEPKAIEPEPKKEEPKAIEPEPKKTVGQEVEGKMGMKPSEMVEGFGTHVLTMLDNISAAFCSNLSGEPSANFKSEPENIKFVHDSIVNYAKSKEMKPLTPAMQLFIAVGVWQIPLIMIGGKKLGQFLMKKFKKQEEPKKSLLDESVDAVVTFVEEKKPMIKEAEQKRKRFEVHASTGAYKYDLNGNNVLVAEAKDFPSDRIKMLVGKNGKTNQFIRDRIEEFYPDVYIYE